MALTWLRPAAAAMAFALASSGERRAGFPLACAKTAKAVRIVVTAGIRGCFGGSDSTIVLERAREQGHESLREWASYDSHRVTDIEVPVDALAQDIAGLIRASEHPVERPGCVTTSKQLARIEVTCDGAPQAPVLYESEACESDELWLPDGGNVDTPSSPHDPAQAVHSWAGGLFGRHRSSPILSDSAEEQERTRRKWGSLYENGRRVRHDPVEDWERDAGR